MGEQLVLGEEVFSQLTEQAIEQAKQKQRDGKKLTKADRILLVMQDGQWHMGSELAEKVSWRFGGYLHELKSKGVNWEKEPVKVASGDRVFKYRLVN